MAEIPTFSRVRQCAGRARATPAHPGPNRGNGMPPSGQYPNSWNPGAPRRSPPAAWDLSVLVHHHLSSHTSYTIDPIPPIWGHFFVFFENFRCFLNMFAVYAYVLESLLVKCVFDQFLPNLTLEDFGHFEYIICF